MDSFNLKTLKALHKAVVITYSLLETELHKTIIDHNICLISDAPKTMARRVELIEMTEDYLKLKNELEVMMDIQHSKLEE